ncbi:PQQ-dependent sugar dehydrogenase [uncultured Ferrovibrio sp.]|jgi:glucose/arabinose dehydrogenase|uniref:PQQ-dependent sugar dehydrogenase n=1 Tax=uncultured Ferrovibrio sp. TaxID=1576913 RepID=UPI00261BCC4B|nr:PQQ-dependent sugar dehydrogenase [uncultured Ferrovibrio sp.]
MRSAVIAFLAGLACLAPSAMIAPVQAQQSQTIRTQEATVRAVTVAKGLENPWGFAFLPDGRILVTERPGRMRLIGKDGKLSAPVEGVPEVFAQGQGGLLDVRLDPDFTTNRTLYFTYAEPGDGGASTALASARLMDNRLETVKVLFRQQPKLGGGNHFGSRVVIGGDGMLWLGLGERFRFDPAQDLSNHLGKVIRLEKDGRVPPDNPFVGRNDAQPEIWSYGHRNIQGMAVHPGTGVVWLNEHGARGGDEINIPEKGKNYGWPVIAYGVHYSGEKIGIGTEAPGMEQPIFYWDPSIAPSGMAFYTGDKIPAWKGNVFIGSLKFGAVYRIILDGTRVTGQEKIDIGDDIRDVRQGPDDLLYLATAGSDGRIIRLEPTR